MPPGVPPGYFGAEHGIEELVEHKGRSSPDVTCRIPVITTTRVAVTHRERSTRIHARPDLRIRTIKRTNCPSAGTDSRSSATTKARRYSRRPHRGRDVLFLARQTVAMCYPWVICLPLLTSNDLSGRGGRQMSHYRSNLRDLEFNLFEVFGVGQAAGQPRPSPIWTWTPPAASWPRCRLAREDLAASYADDRPRTRRSSTRPPTRSTMPDGVQRSYQAFMDSEFWRMDLPAELDGTAAPRAFWWSLAEMVLGSNAPIWMYASGPSFATTLNREGTAGAEALGEALRREALGLDDGAHRAGRRLRRRRRPHPRDPAGRTAPGTSRASSASSPAASTT